MTFSIRRPGCGKSTATLTLTLQEKPTAASFLAIEGQDDDKPGVSIMRVTVNGTPVFSGLNCFPERSWGRMGISIPAGLLKSGENTIIIANTTPDVPSRSARFSDVNEAAKDPQWGWIAISEAYWLDPNGAFDRFINGKPETWCIFNGNNRGTAKVTNGQIILSEAEMGPAFYYGHISPKIAITPDSQIKLTVKASGNGVLRMGLWNYRSYKGEDIPKIAVSGFSGEATKLLLQSKSPEFKLSSTPASFSCILTPPKGTGFVIPRIYTDKGTEAIVTEFNMDILPPNE